ncbi:MAG: hypothetical protein COV45_04970 [Deltaproteobacteria bacterium CG11_big_fil_rev_8_21_14_0_20_47_16]|nr:MAG: hypothetical protein COV45_04970 [Deltaproteobacteria bacterium CG11_big_fil_rev_8_21_14_0_20_47_16]
MEKLIKTPAAQYRVVRPLGEGGMGQVLLVQAPHQKDPVALKFLQAQHISEVRIEGFKREFALLSELHHPHLPHVYDFGYATSHNQYFFTTEFVEGQELYRALRQAPFEEIETVLLQVLSALDFLHSINLVHFDVKGENVLVARDSNSKWQAKLVDFGVTSPANRELTEVAGTLHYIAPELLLPDPISDGRCDLYSFGVMAYYLLSGQFPYTLRSFDDVWEWHRNHPHLDLEPLKLHGVPDYFCQMIERLMKPNPSERFSSAAVVMNFLALHSGRSQAEMPTVKRAQIEEGPFVGRAGLMTTIKNALHASTKRRSKKRHTQENTPHTFLLSGRDGMGKTRFLKELKFVAQLVDYSVRLVDLQECGESMERFKIGLGIIDGNLPNDNIQKELIEDSKKQPLCIAFDNLNDAAPIVKRFIFTLIGTLYNATLIEDAPPLVVVATTSDESVQSILGAITVSMAPLKYEEVESYLQQLIGSPEDFESFLQSVWKFSGGIPLLMAEAARQYHQQGSLPESIEELYSQHLETLNANAKRILHCLAFAGVPLPHAILEIVSGVPLDKEIQSILQAGLVQYNEGRGDYSLATGALSSVLSQQLSDTERSELADPLLVWIEGTPGCTSVDAARYAPYSRDLIRSSRILEQAIELSERSGKAQQALQFLKELANLRHKLNMTGEIIAINRRIAIHLLYLGQIDDSEQVVRKTMTLTQSPQVEDLKLLGLLSRMRRKPDEAGKLYDQALSLLPVDPNDPTYLFLQNERALAWLEEGNVAKAIPMLMQSHRDAKKLPFDKRRRVTNNNLGAALARSGQLKEAILFYKDKLDLFQHDLRLQGSISSQLATVQLRAGLLDDAIDSFELAWKIANQTGDLHNGKIIIENIISLLQKKTSYTKALQYAKKSLELKSVGSSPQDMGRSLMTLATLYLNLGVSDLAGRYLIQAMRIVRRCRDYQLLGWIHMNYGYLYKDLGRLMESINAFEETIFIAEEHKDEELLRWGQYGAADVLVDHGELEEAKPYITTLSKTIDSVQDPEFKARFELLQNRIQVLKTPKPGPELAQNISTLIDECRQNNWLELEWEAEYLLGTLYQKRDEYDHVRIHMSKAAEIIQSIADGLSEEYRGGFLKHRIRARVFSELNAAENNEAYVTEATSISNESMNTPQPPVDEEFAQMKTSIFSPDPAASLKTQASVPAIITNDKVIQFSPKKPLIEYEREVIEATLAYYHNDLDATAQALGITSESLQWKLEQLGISCENAANEQRPS